MTTRRQGLAWRTAAALLVAGAFVPQTMAAAAAVKKPNLAPSVHITSPGSTDLFIAPAIVTVTADASDSDGTIKSVKFFADGGLVATATQAPYSAKWKDAPAGAHSLTAVALDNGGAETTSAARIVIVRPNTPPTVQLTSPAGGATFVDPETIAISADAGDSDGTVKSVKFFADGALLGTTTKLPYSVKWHDAPNGAHSLTAVALDNGGAETTSAAVMIAVS